MNERKRRGKEKRERKGEKRKACNLLYEGDLTPMSRMVCQSRHKYIEQKIDPIENNILGSMCFESCN
jgi:hypothetical protein